MLTSSFQLAAAAPRRRAQLLRSAVASACVALLFGAHAMDLRQAYEAAQANDAQIRAARSGAEASRERLPQARAQLLPNVSLSAGRNHNDLTSKGRNFAGQPTTSKTSITLATRPCLCASRCTARTRVRRCARPRHKWKTLMPRWNATQSLVVRVGEAYFDALLAEDQLELVLAQNHLQHPTGRCAQRLCRRYGYPHRCR